jgi:hypothetical protein
MVKVYAGICGYMHLSAGKCGIRHPGSGVNVPPIEIILLFYFFIFLKKKSLEHWNK